MKTVYNISKEDDNNWYVVETLVENGEEKVIYAQYGKILARVIARVIPEMHHLLLETYGLGR